ncbi:MAG: M48 family metallopeptidase [Bryobacterales bacterium]|nr:M48 family metallopeptidase [Bryobacterales bacterium]
MNSFPGQYYDGRSAQSHAVEVTPAPHGLAIQLPGAGQLWWPFEQVSVRRTAQSISFHKGEPLAESVVMDHPAFLAVLRELNPRVANGQSDSAVDAWVKLGGLAVAALAIVAVLVVYGFPLMISVMASLVPVSVEKKLGEAALPALAPAAKRCQDASIDRIVSQLSRASGDDRYQFHTYIVEDPMVNAFAAPGGYVVLFRGLLDKTRRPEEAAAVLAHEMQHVLHRHSVRGLMRGASIWIALALLTGGSPDLITGLAGSLGGLAYQRGDESQADRDGLRLLEEARIDPAAMVRMLEILENLQGDAPEPLRYFSSHPLTKDRIDAVREMASSFQGKPVRLLSGEPWPPPVCR